jgi:methionine-rich copper-binding protein CopC
LKDAAGNALAAAATTTAISAADITAPTLSSSTPADDATAIAVGANIVLTMSETVTAVTGKNIVIKKTSGDTTVATIDAADAQVSISGGVVTINPTADLTVNTEYYVKIDSGAFKDAANNVYTGISSTTALSFTTDVLLSGTVAATTLNTLDDASVSAIDASAVTTITGAVADVKTAMTSAGITKAANVAVTLSDAGSLADTDAILTATTGVVTTAQLTAGTYANFATGDKIATGLTFQNHTSQTLATDSNINWNLTGATLTIETTDNGSAPTIVELVLTGVTSVTEVGGVFTIG